MTVPTSNQQEPAGFSRARLHMFLWLIPIFAWILLLFVFTRNPRTEWVPLFSSQDKQNVTKVEHFLENRGIAFDIAEEGIIQVASEERDRVQQQLAIHGLLKREPKINLAGTLQLE